jgi:hypothetical protein
MNCKKVAAIGFKPMRKRGQGLKPAPDIDNGLTPLI